MKLSNKQKTLTVCVILGLINMYRVDCERISLFCVRCLSHLLLFLNDTFIIHTLN